MIIINENRRLWEVNHKVEAISDTEIKVTIDEIDEIFELSGLADGEGYVLEDCINLPYNPITGIQKKDGVITVNVFYDDPHKREIECPFKRENVKISEYPLLVDIIKQESERISDLAVKRNYELLPQYKRDNIYSGSPASDGYPEYLIGEAGKQTIAKMNGYFRQMSKQIVASMPSKTRAEILAIGDPFPKTAEELLAILNK